MSAWAPGRRMRPARRGPGPACRGLGRDVCRRARLAPTPVPPRPPPTAPSRRSPCRSAPSPTAPRSPSTPRSSRPPSGGPHPAVLLAHGFGGSKADLTDQAHELQRARLRRAHLVGARVRRAPAGGSTSTTRPTRWPTPGLLVDLLATRPEVRLDAPGDPRVGVAGGSYGGALALMLGATDRRVDAVAASITWNDLAQAFFPQQADDAAPPPSTPAALDADRDARPVQAAVGVDVLPVRQRRCRARHRAGAAPATTNPVCGRFDPTVCRLFLAVGRAGTPSPELLALLRAHSPAAVLAGLKAPTYLVQGMADSLFGLAQADATARALAAQGTPGRRALDGRRPRRRQHHRRLRRGVGAHLARPLPPRPTVPHPPAGIPLPAFVYADPRAPPPARRPAAPDRRLRGVGDDDERPAAAGRRPTSLLAPPGGEPAAITGLPGGGRPARDHPADLPARRAPRPVGRVRLRRARAADPHRRGAPRAPHRHLHRGVEHALPQPVAGDRRRGDVPPPARRAASPCRPRPASRRRSTSPCPPPPGRSRPAAPCACSSPPPTRRMPGPRAARADRLAVDATGLVLPTVAGTTLSAESDADTESIGVAIATGVVLLALLASWWWRRRRRREHPLPARAGRRAPRRLAPGQDLPRRPPRRRRRLVAGRTRPGGGPARPQRRRQDHHAADGHGPDPARLGHRARAGPADRRRRSRAGPGRRAHRGSGLPAPPHRPAEPAGLLGRHRTRRRPTPPTPTCSTWPPSAAPSTAPCAPTATA